eukprot:6458331-Amphidinium_carterae.2
MIIYTLSLSLCGVLWTLNDLECSLQNGSNEWWLVVLAEVDDRANAAARESARKGTEGWHQWAKEAVAKGGPKAHRWAKRDRLQHDVLGEDGEPLMDTSSLAVQEHFWWSLWKQHEAAELPLPATPPPPPMQLERLRAVLSEYPHTKAPGGDGWRIRSWALLPRPYLLRLLEVLAVWERDAVLPESMTTLVTLIQKPGNGGVRPIAKTAALQRLWAKIRRKKADEWEASVTLRSHWSGKDKGCDRAIWEHALRLQSARARGQEALTLLLDLQKFYDSIGHRAMLDSLAEVDFPTHLWRCCSGLYTGPRCLEFNRCVGRIDKASGTVLPGCAIASSVIKALLLPLLRHLESTWPFGTVTSVFDDLSLETTGQVAHMETEFVEAAQCVVQWLQDRRLPLSPSKSYVLASTCKLRARVRETIGCPHIIEASTASQLGVGTQLDGRRCAWLQKKRQRDNLAKLARLKRLRKAKTHITPVVRAGPTSSLVWGSEVQGWSCTSMALYRRQCARAQFSIPKSGNPDLVMAANPAAQTWDAGHCHHKRVITRWSSCVWKQEVPIDILWGALAGASDALRRSGG